MNEGNFSSWGPTLAIPWSHTQWYMTEHTSMHTHAHTCTHMPSLMLLRSPELSWLGFHPGRAGWRQISCEPSCSGGRGPAAQSPRRQSLINFSAERNGTQLATVPNSFETSNWKFELLNLFCDDRGTSIDADFAKHKDTSWKLKSEPWICCKRILQNSGVAWCRLSFHYS